MEKVILTPRELVLPEATTLDSGILSTYQEGIKSYNLRARSNLNVFLGVRGDLIGSNCFAPIELRKHLPEGARIATMADLGRATEINPEFLSGFYAETGLVLGTEGDSHKPNDFLAKKLTKQLSQRNINLKTPKIIYFDALNLEEDKNSDYGLVYILNERARLGENIIDAPEFVRDYNFKKINDKGIPIEDENGRRICFTRQDGLSRFCLGWASSVDSWDRDLAYSNDYGRVVVVKTSEAGHGEFEKSLFELKKERERQIADIKQKYEKASSILTGK